ncbi:hypothetical protein M436DRAFT_73976 [Aureobasidium namibiae CBS 147.97]|uniref:Aminoglycoside phosphotransferase domain-containing protein n=1 Tax=Aureobasidium namibiae CBS 147.97 TaxID=1043004 RepID=A0A074WGW7_9PEZI|nr:uncharacterized protein M436DRAFT_73976 [Aureobasidium namibiae CBS 147.97]KEQ72268.1 hypothetical protein M436DRAFT_73976 [Aureobasidium namibiae CBS 147.97]
MKSPMWPCDYDKCERPAVRILGDCVLCSKHLCSEHLQRSYHRCATPEDGDLFYQEIAKAEDHEIAQLVNRIDLERLSLRASSLRDDVSCRIEVPTDEKNERSYLMGGMNLHLRIVFEDGIIWLARVRRSNATSPPPHLQDYIIRSEIATLRSLETTSIPTPKVWDYDIGGENPVGVGHILMDCMPGKPLDWSSTSKEGRGKVIAQLADIYVELQRFQFGQMGSMNRVGENAVGPFARECLTDSAGPTMQPLGPFADLREYYRGSTNLLLDLIHRGELIYKFLNEQLANVYPDEGNPPTGFYLTHADDKGSHILVDAKSNITAIIDREWVFVAPEPLAFNSPMLLLPTSDFFNGESRIGKEEQLFAECLEERGAKDLAKIVRNGRLHHQLAFLCTLDLCLSFEDLLGLFKGFRSSMGVDHQYSWQEWRQLSLKRFGQDDKLKDILARSG